MSEAVPPHLCETMRIVVQGEDRLIEYVDRFREYGIPYGDGSFQVLSYCPFCGAKLPKSLRDEWFRAIHGMGLEAGDPAMPDEYRSGDWWRRTSK
jgi:uncharacterized protein DUF6980